MTRPPSAAVLLGQLERLREHTGTEAAARKEVLLDRLDRRRQKTSAAVGRLHEVLLYLRAYPDSPGVRRRVERMLAGFDARPDLRRHGEELLDTGIAGTPIYFPFFWSTALWLVERWPDRLTLDWETLDTGDLLGRFKHLLVPYAETPALDSIEESPREWLERSKGDSETDAAFLVRRFAALPSHVFVREALYDQIDPLVRLDPGPDTPSRTRARYPRSKVVYQRTPVDRARPDLREAVREAPASVRPVSPAEGRRLIDLTRGAMVTRARDLDIFMHADPRDVRIVDYGDGLQFVVLGAHPERRLVLESVYGFLTLRNGVPIGYVLASALLGSSEIAYNVFDPYRGGEAARIFGRVLATVHHLFGSDAFSLDPYQLGYGNAEGLASGAWWFYYKLGFRPKDPRVRRLLRGELAAMKRRPGHRTRPDVLEQLASAPLFYYLGAERADVLGHYDLGKPGAAVTRLLARRFGSDREGGLETCSREAAELLGVKSFRGFSAGERIAWERWAPLVLVLPGVRRWSPADRRALAAVVRAKGGRRESDFVLAFNAHPRLVAAFRRLAADG